MKTKPSKMFYLIIAVAAMAMNLMDRRAHGEVLYRITDYPALQGSVGASFVGMSNDGENLIIRSGIDSGPRLVYLSNNGQTTVLPSTAPLSLSSEFINDLGQLATSGLIQATAINDSGQLIGQSSDGQVLLQTGFQVANLGGLISNGRNIPLAINDSGQIAGYSYGPDAKLHPFLYSGGKFVDLGTSGAALAINSQGDVAGGNGTDDSLPFLYHDGKLITLGSLGGLKGLAIGINDQAQVVGWSFAPQDGTFREHAFLYQNGTMLDLNTLIDPSSGLLIHQAIAIDRSGRIAADASDAQGMSHAILLTPYSVPEPGSVIVAGCLTFAGLVRSRRGSWGKRKVA